jgi:hypothetical protein
MSQEENESGAPTGEQAAGAPDTGAPAPAPASSDSGQPAADASADGRLGKLIALAHSPDRAAQEKYATPEVQAEVARLMEAKVAGELVVAKPTFTAEDLAELKDESEAGEEPAEGEAEESREENSPEDDRIPETAAGYTIPARPDGEARTTLDADLITAALKRFHMRGFTQTDVNEVFAALDTAEAEADRVAAEYGERTVAELEQEFGERAQANMKAANSWLVNEFDSVLADVGGAKALVKLRLPNGQRLGDHRGFFDWVFTKSKERAPIRDAEAEPATPLDRDRRIEQIVALAHRDDETSRREYARRQPELQRLVAEKSQGTSTAAAADTASVSIADLDRRIAAITRLAHTGKPADEAEYKRRQPELEQLMTAKVRAGRR